MRPAPGRPDLTTRRLASLRCIWGARPARRHARPAARGVRLESSVLQDQLRSALAGADQGRSGQARSFPLIADAGPGDRHGPRPALTPTPTTFPFHLSAQQTFPSRSRGKRPAGAGRQEAGPCPRLRLRAAPPLPPDPVTVSCRPVGRASPSPLCSARNMRFRQIRLPRRSPSAERGTNPTAIATKGKTYDQHQRPDEPFSPVLCPAG